MSEGNKNNEKEAVQEVSSSNSAADQSRESLSNQAIDTAIKSVQSGAQHAADSMKGTSASNDLPKVTFEDSGHSGKAAAMGAEQMGKAAQDAKNGSQIGKIGETAGGEGISKAAREIAHGMKNDSNYKADLKEDSLNDLKADKFADAIKDGKINPEDLRSQLQDLFKPKDGVEKLPTGDGVEELPTGDGVEELPTGDGVEELPTGDYVVREDGKQTLFTPNGDRVTINPDGSNSIKGDVREVKTNEDGTTTVTFGDGAKVSFDKEGLLSVDRGNQGVSFGRHGGIGIGHSKPFPEFPGKYGGGLEEIIKKQGQYKLFDKKD